MIHEQVTRRGVAGASSPRTFPGLVLVAGLVISLLAIVYCIFAFGHVSGREFSPDDFTRRSFGYFQLPLFQVQVTPVWRDDDTRDLERMLIAEKLVPLNLTTPAAKRWDLVEVHSPVLMSGDAKILCEYLDAVDDQGKIVWLTWTRQNPDLARALWPLVAEMARARHYVVIPWLLAETHGATDPQEFQQRLRRTLAARFTELARRADQAQHPAEAAARRADARRYDPEQASSPADSTRAGVTAPEK